MIANLLKFIPVLIVVLFAAALGTALAGDKHLAAELVASALCAALAHLCLTLLKDALPRRLRRRVW
jgi:hypothetical protein